MEPAFLCSCILKLSFIESSVGCEREKGFPSCFHHWRAYLLLHRRRGLLGWNLEFLLLDSGYIAFSISAQLCVLLPSRRAVVVFHRSCTQASFIKHVFVIWQFLLRLYLRLEAAPTTAGTEQTEAYASQALCPVALRFLRGCPCGCNVFQASPRPFARTSVAGCIFRRSDG